MNGGRRPGYARPVAGQAEFTSRQRRSLAEDGYLLVPSVLAADAVAALAARPDQLARAVAMWCITGFTRDNGPLRVIPGSHHSAHDPADDMEFPGMGPHPDEVRLIAPAGSLILFNSASLWHSGTMNYSPGLRLAVTTYLSTPAKPPPA